MGVCTTRTPSLWNTSSNEVVNLPSRSWIRKRIRSNRPVKPRLRACWTTQAPVGFLGAAGEVNASASELDEEQHAAATQRHRLDGEEVAGEQARRLATQKGRPALRWRGAARARAHP